MYNELYKDKKKFSEYLNSQNQIRRGRIYVAKQISTLINVNNPRKIIIAPSDIGQFLEPIRNIYDNNKGISYNLIDKHREPLNHIKKNYSNLKINLIKSRIEDYNPYKINGDVIFSLFGLHLIDELDKVIQKFSLSIGDFGELFILTMTPNQATEHPLGEFYGTVNNFENYERIIQLLKDNDFQNISENEIVYRDNIENKNIEKVFSKYSNSFLYTKSNDELDSFYQNLRSKAISSSVSLTFKWTIITGNKGLTND